MCSAITQYLPFTVVYSNTGNGNHALHVFATSEAEAVNQLRIESNGENITPICVIPMHIDIERDLYLCNEDSNNPSALNPVYKIFLGNFTYYEDAVKTANEIGFQSFYFDFQNELTQLFVSKTIWNAKQIQDYFDNNYNKLQDSEFTFKSDWLVLNQGSNNFDFISWLESAFNVSVGALVNI